jgi:hypothetical protein
LPLEAGWLIAAFGLVELSAEEAHEGPFPRGNNELEIRSWLARPGGDLIRSLIVDSTYGWITEQRISNESGQHLAVVSASQFRFYPNPGVSLPHRIAIELPLMQVAFQLDVSSYQVNTLFEDPEELWTMPTFEGQRVINLATSAMPMMARNSSAAPALYETADRRRYHPRYRGYSPIR